MQGKVTDNNNGRYILVCSTAVAMALLTMSTSQAVDFESTLNGFRNSGKGKLEQLRRLQDFNSSSKDLESSQSAVDTEWALQVAVDTEWA